MPGFECQGRAGEPRCKGCCYAPHSDRCGATPSTAPHPWTRADAAQLRAAGGPPRLGARAGGDPGARLGAGALAPRAGLPGRFGRGVLERALRAGTAGTRRVAAPSQVLSQPPALRLARELAQRPGLMHIGRVPRPAVPGAAAAAPAGHPAPRAPAGGVARNQQAVEGPGNGQALRCAPTCLLAPLGTALQGLLRVLCGSAFRCWVAAPAPGYTPLWQLHRPCASRVLRVPLCADDSVKMVGLAELRPSSIERLVALVQREGASLRDILSGLEEAFSPPASLAAAAGGSGGAPSGSTPLPLPLSAAAPAPAPAEGPGAAAGAAAGSSVAAATSGSSPAPSASAASAAAGPGGSSREEGGAEGRRRGEQEDSSDSEGGGRSGRRRRGGHGRASRRRGR